MPSYVFIMMSVPGEKKYEKLKMGIYSDSTVHWSFSGFSCVVRYMKYSLVKINWNARLSSENSL